LFLEAPCFPSMHHSIKFQRYYPVYNYKSNVVWSCWIRQFFGYGLSQKMGLLHGSSFFWAFSTPKNGGRRRLGRG